MADLARRKPGTQPAAAAKRLRRSHPLLTVLGRLVGIRTRDQAFSEGAKGERRTGRKLNRMCRWRRNWHVLHSISWPGGGDVDHVLICRRGVYSINTKYHRAQVDVQRQKVVVQTKRKRANDYISPARWEAERVSEVLSNAVGWSVPVKPLVVFVGASEIRGWRWRSFQRVKFLPLSSLSIYLWCCRRSRFTADQVAQLFAVARNSDTWRGSVHKPQGNKETFGRNPGPSVGQPDASAVPDLLGQWDFNSNVKF